MELNIPSGFFNDIYLKYAFNNQRRIQIYYGGSSSGKSYAIVGQRTVLDILKGKRNYLICRNTGSTIVQSVWTEVMNAIYSLKLEAAFETNKTERIITCRLNRKQIIFKGLDDVQKIKSIRAKDGPITDVVIEEGTELRNINVIKDLLKRQRGKSTVKKRLTILFNPIFKNHFLYKEYFQPLWDDSGAQFQADDTVSILKTTYKDNRRFLTIEDIKDLEDETDKYYYEVYTLGNWGILGNLIFKNWKVQDLESQMESFANLRHGVDWGFAKDPFAYTKIAIDHTRKKLYFLEEVCAIELSNEQSANAIRPYTKDELVICDSAEPKSINEYRTKYRINAIKAKKGPGSIITGIRWMQSYEIIINKKLQNTTNEISMYKYKENKLGEVLPLPVDHNNHIIDAARYATENDIIERPGPVNVRI